MAVFALAERGAQYAVYVCELGDEPSDEERQVALEVDLSEGAYRAAWVNTLSSDVDGAEDFVHEGGARELESPGFTGDVALRIIQKGESHHE